MTRARSSLRRALGLLAALWLSACGEVAVVQGVPELEANRAVGALDQAGIASRKEADEGGSSGAATFRVNVGPDEVARAVAVLQAHALPRREEAGFAETYGQASLVQTATEERARAAQAVAGELARSLERVDGVLDARVHLSLPDTSGLLLEGQAPPRGSASVLLRHSGATPPLSEDAVRRLVAGAVAGLRGEDVTVVLVARPLPPASAEARLAWVGPVAVARGSAGTLKALLAGALGLNVLLAGVLAAVLLLRRRRDEAAEAAPPRA